MADLTERIAAELENIDGVLARIPSDELLPGLSNWNWPAWRRWFTRSTMVSKMSSSRCCSRVTLRCRPVNLGTKNSSS